MKLLSMIKYIFSKICLPSLFLFVANNFIYAQRFDSLLNEAAEKYAQEKIYLHFDRSCYNPGETIWFKGYLTSNNLPSRISSTVYAELIDEKATVLQRKIIPVIESGAAASFDLPDTIRSPLLYIRAFTTWMLNFDSSLFYIKPVYIVNSMAVTKKSPAPVAYSLNFFPEGGDLVLGVNSRVAFKANDQEGKPIAIAGSITDSKGKKIIDFSSIHDGMGYFSLTPLPGEKYKANWKDKKGVLHETILPTAKKQGVVLNTSTNSGNIIYTLSRPDSVETAFTSFTVVAQMHQQLMYSAMINMSRKTTISAPISIDSFPDGILQLTVFNAAQMPVAERLLFINHNNYYFITDLHAIEKNIKKRGHNTLQVDVGGSLLSNLSIAVTDESVNPASTDKENIFSQLLLTSDLKGYVHNPAYYFSSDEDSVKQQLDLVMMTNGWRRFKWEPLLNGQWPALKRLPENFLSVKGKIYGLSQSLLTDKELTCILKTKNNVSQLLIAPVNKEGQFVLKNIYFFDTARLYYQLNNDKDKKLTSIASFSFENTFPKLLPPSTTLLTSLYPYIPDTSVINKNKAVNNLLREQFFEGNKIKSLDAVTVKSRKKTPQEKMDEEYTSGFFSGGDAMTFSTENDPFASSSFTVLNYLQGKVAGLQISTTGEGSVSWRGETPSLFLNETSTQLNSVQSISMNDVAMIKVFRPPFFGAMGGGSGGAIAIYTKKGVSPNNAMIKGLDFANINGYSAIKEFYSPDYENNTMPGLNDYRTTLYWNPYLLMDKNKRRIKIPFYNNDNCKKIRVVIEGINEAGQLTREEKIFE